MPPIRKFLLETAVLIGTVIAVSASIGGYLSSVPDTPEHVAIATAWADPETTGSIAMQAESASTTTGQGTSVDTTQAAQADDPAKGTWTDPPRRRKPR